MPQGIIRGDGVTQPVVYIIPSYNGPSGPYGTISLRRAGTLANGNFQCSSNGIDWLDVRDLQDVAISAANPLFTRNFRAHAPFFRVAFGLTGAIPAADSVLYWFVR